MCIHITKHGERTTSKFKTTQSHAQIFPRYTLTHTEKKRIVSETQNYSNDSAHTHTTINEDERSSNVMSAFSWSCVYIDMYFFQIPYPVAKAARQLQEWQYRLELPKLCYQPGWRLMRLGYRTCFHTLYVKIWTLRLSGKQDDSLERQSDSSESWSDILERQEF